MASRRPTAQQDPGDLVAELPLRLLEPDDDHAHTVEVLVAVSLTLAASALASGERERFPEVSNSWVEIARGYFSLAEQTLAAADRLGWLDKHRSTSPKKARQTPDSAT